MRVDGGLSMAAGDAQQQPHVHYFYGFASQGGFQGNQPHPTYGQAAYTYLPPGFQVPGSPTPVDWPASPAPSTSTVTSHQSGYTQFLGNRRAFSPQAWTPTSSVASSPNHGHHHMEPPRSAQFQYQAYHQEYQPAPETTPEAIENSLQGIPQLPRGSSQPPQAPHGILGPPLGRSPLLPRAHPSFNEPWNTYAVENGSLSQTISAGELCAQDAASPNGSEGSNTSSGKGNRDRRPGRRHGPLEPEARQKTSEVRKKGACLRCWLYRESCDYDGPTCKRCQSNLRKWHLGCVRVWLKARQDYLQPHAISTHLTFDSYNGFLNQNAYQFDYKRRPSHRINLHWNLGPGIPPITFMVKKIEPFGERLIQQHGFRVYPQTRDTGEVECVEMVAPPLSPDLTYPGFGKDDIRNQIKAWLHAVLINNSDYLPWHCFWNESAEWEREIFFAIWTYHHTCPVRHEALTTALRLVIINHAMTHAAVVPEAEVAQLYTEILPEETSGRDYGSSKVVCPKIVDRCLRCLMIPFADHLVTLTLKNLEGLLLEKSPSVVQQDLAFCVAFLTMMVLGRNQIVAWDRATLNDKEKQEGGLTFDQARTLITQMESELGDLVIRLYQFKIKPCQKRRPAPGPGAISEAEHFALQFGLLGRLSQNYELHKNDLPLVRELDVIDKGFSSTNLCRILAKFYTSVFGD